MTKHSLKELVDSLARVSKLPGAEPYQSQLGDILNILVDTALLKKTLSKALEDRDISVPAKKELLLEKANLSSQI